MWEKVVEICGSAVLFAVMVWYLSEWTWKFGLKIGSWIDKLKFWRKR